MRKGKGRSGMAGGRKEMVTRCHESTSGDAIPYPVEELVSTFWTGYVASARGESRKGDGDGDESVQSVNDNLI